MANIAKNQTSNVETSNVETVQEYKPIIFNSVGEYYGSIAYKEALKAGAAGVKKSQGDGSSLSFAKFVAAKGLKAGDLVTLTAVSIKTLGRDLHQREDKGGEKFADANILNITFAAENSSTPITKMLNTTNSIERYKNITIGSSMLFEVVKYDFNENAGLTLSPVLLAKDENNNPIAG